MLETGELRVRRPDAEELTAVRDGALPFEALLAFASWLQSRMEETALKTTLPTDVDPGFVDGLAFELIHEAR